jgi:hypothetical protein
VNPKGIKIRHKARTKGIEVDRAHHVFNVGILLADYGLIAVLEEMSGPFMSAIETSGVPGEQSGHNRG